MTTLINESLSWQQVFNRPHLEEEPLKGILSYLNDEHGGNIHNNRIFLITSNSIQNSYCTPENVAYFTADNYYLSLNKLDSHICFDFLDHEIQIQSYLIKVSTKKQLKNCNNEWKIIDTRTNCKGLKPEDIRCVFIPSLQDKSFYRYVRLRQTRYNWQDDYQMKIVFIEFYGKLHKR